MEMRNRGSGTGKRRCGAGVNEEVHRVGCERGQKTDIGGVSESECQDPDKQPSAVVIIGQNPWTPAPSGFSVQCFLFVGPLANRSSRARTPELHLTSLQTLRNRHTSICCRHGLFNMDLVLFEDSVVFIHVHSVEYVFSTRSSATQPCHGLSASTPLFFVFNSWRTTTVQSWKKERTIETQQPGQVYLRD